MIESLALPYRIIFRRLASIIASVEFGIQSDKSIFLVSCTHSNFDNAEKTQL